MASSINISMIKKNKRGCRTNRDDPRQLLFSSPSSFSSQRSQIHFPKHNFRYLAVIVMIYCSVSLSSFCGYIFPTSKPPMVVVSVSALLLAPTTKPPTRHARKRNTRTRDHLLKTSTETRLASSTNGENNIGIYKSGNNAWRSNLPRDVYASPLLWEGRTEWVAFLKQFGSKNGETNSNSNSNEDPLWEQVKLEALTQLSTEPEAGPQLYQSILSQGSLVEAIVSIIAST